MPGKIGGSQMIPNPPSPAAWQNGLEKGTLLLYPPEIEIGLKSCLTLKVQPPSAIKTNHGTEVKLNRSFKHSVYLSAFLVLSEMRSSMIQFSFCL